MARVKKPIYSRDLGINLESGRERELFKWFLAFLDGRPRTGGVGVAGESHTERRTALRRERFGTLTAP